jgi:hypothetical protein
MEWEKFAARGAAPGVRTRRKLHLLQHVHDALGQSLVAEHDVELCRRGSRSRMGVGVAKQSIRVRTRLANSSAVF